MTKREVLNLMALGLVRLASCDEQNQILEVVIDGDGDFCDLRLTTVDKRDRNKQVWYLRAGTIIEHIEVTAERVDAAAAGKRPRKRTARKTNGRSLS